MVVWRVGFVRLGCVGLIYGVVVPWWFCDLVVYYGCYSLLLIVLGRGFCCYLIICCFDFCC